MTIEVAITFDDLPGVDASVITHIINTLREHSISGVYGFINGLTLQLEPTHINILHEWLQAGNFLANHTYSHLNLSQTTSNEYINDIEKNAAILATLPKCGKKYFRYPFLEEGDTFEKRDAVRRFLFSRKYQIVPVTIPIEEYRWNTTFINCLLQNDQTGLALLKNNLVKHALAMLDIASHYAQLLFGRNVKHILLLHGTLFNAFILNDILAAYKAAGVAFISLESALAEDFYQINPGVLGVEYFGFLGQLRAARQLAPTEAIRVATKNFMRRYTDEYCTPQ